MKKYYLILSIVILFLAACSAETVPTNSEPTVPETNQQQEEVATAEPANIDPDVTRELLEEAYPSQPEAVTLPEDYPGFAEDAYPTEEDVTETEPAAEEDMEMIWVLRPMGIQCEDSGRGDPQKGIQGAVEELAAAGVSAERWEVTEMMVTAVCGSPTSAHYRASIALNDLSIATTLGWVAE